VKSLSGRISVYHPECANAPEEGDQFENKLSQYPQNSDH
jgi:hypothetical protein